MTWKSSALVIANQTADSPELIDALRARHEQTPTRYTLVVPATPRAQGDSGRAHAQELADKAIATMREAGLEVEGGVGDPDPYVAASEAWNPRDFDEIIVATLPTHASKWLQADLPHRVARATGAPVLHVVSGLAPEPPHSERVPEQDHRASLGALSVLSWGTREPGSA